MKYPRIVRTATLAAALGAGAAFAQTPPAVVTDVGPPPAEDRSSVGAVIDTATLKAQQTAALQNETKTARSQDESSDTRRMGAGPAPAKKPVRKSPHKAATTER